MKRKKYILLLGAIVVCMLLFAYRDVFFHGKILFPSNYLASFYSPWSTYSFPGWGHRIPNKPIGVDLVRFFYPNWEFAISEVKSGRIPLWNPYIFSGDVFLADFQSALFFPPNWLYFIVPQYTAWMMLHFFPYFFSAFFTYLFARKIKLHPYAAILSAISFAFSGYMISWMQENTVVPDVAAFLPLLLLLIEYYVTTFQKKFLLFFSFSWALSFFAGHLQTDFYITLLAAVYFIYRILKNGKLSNNQRKNAFLWLLGYFLLGLAISAVQFFPSFEAFLYSARPGVNSFITTEKFLLPISHLITLLVADWYGNPGAYNYFGPTFYHETALSIGVVGFVFALYAFIYKASSKAKFFLVTSLIAFFLTNDNVITKFLLTLNIPLLSTFVPSRILLLVNFSVAVLAGIGLSTYIEAEKKGSKKILAWIIGISLLVIILANIWNVIISLHKTFFPKGNIYMLLHVPLHELLLSLKKENAFISLKNSVIPSVMLFFLFISVFFKKKYVIVFVAIIFTCVSQLWLLNKYFMPGEKAFLYPDIYVLSTLQSHMKPTDRFISVGDKMAPNVFLPFHIATPEGLDPIYNYRYGQLVNATKDGGKITQTISRVEVLFSNPNQKQRETMEDNVPRSRLLSLLGIDYIAYHKIPQDTFSLPPNKIFPTKHFSLIGNKGGWYIFHYKNAFPRVFLADGYSVHTNLQQIANSLFNRHFAFQKKLILEKNIHKQLTPLKTTDNARITTYKSQSIQIQTNTSGPKLLFLSDTFYPGWEATIDGTSTKIYRADGAFRAVYVPAGKHTIAMRYKPKSFYYGIAVTVAALVISLLLLIRRSPQKKKLT